MESFVEMFYYSQFSLYRAKVDGTSRSKFAPSNAFGSVTSFCIDWISRLLFWADGTAATIQVLKLDGPTYYQKIILAGGNSPDKPSRVAEPVSLAVDPVNGSVASLCCKICEILVPWSGPPVLKGSA